MRDVGFDPFAQRFGVRRIDASEVCARSVSTGSSWDGGIREH